MSILSEIQDIINKFNRLNLVSKMQNIPMEMTSKFSTKIKIKDISKFSNLPKNIKSDLDMPIPMEIELWVLCEGENKDGIIPISELIESVPRWGEGINIIPFHDLEDMDTITSYSIADDCGCTDSARIEEKDGKKYVVADGRITNRNVAYQMYLRELKGNPIEISGEYKWIRDFDLGGNTIQTNIRPGVISLVDKGHIEGNEIKIKSHI